MWFSVKWNCANLSMHTAHDRAGDVVKSFSLQKWKIINKLNYFIVLSILLIWNIICYNILIKAVITFKSLNMDLFKNVIYNAAVTFLKSHPLFVVLLKTVYCFIFSNRWYILLSCFQLWHFLFTSLQMVRCRRTAYAQSLLWFRVRSVWILTTDYNDSRNVSGMRDCSIV